MSTSSRSAKARARANFALIKYWGKAAGELNVPAVGSISITLDALWSDTEVEFAHGLSSDDFVLDGKRRPADLGKVSACLDLLRALKGTTERAIVRSTNNFPTGAGLASSASGFAALVTAAAAALELDLSGRELSILARQGSGSAARSIFGGFVEMHAGSADDGRDSYAEPLLDASLWPLEVVIAITAKEEKQVDSRSGMTRSAQASPYYPAWVATHPADLDAARDAIRRRNFAALAEVAEANCLKMHAAAIAARPPLIYWNAATLHCITLIQRLRREGLPVFFTIDAGPQVKAICEPRARAEVEQALRALPGVLQIITSSLGRGAELST